MLFVNSTSNATRHAVYAIERNPPATVRASGAAVTAIVEQFPWGPEGLYTTAGMKDFIDNYAPGGMPRTGAGYMSIIGKAWPVLKVSRVLGTGAAVAVAALSDAVPAVILNLGLKYKGAAGNAVTWTVSDATDGDVNHFDLTVSVTSVSGTTSDVLKNLNYSGTGADSVPSFVGMKLLGSITKALAGRPANGTGSFSAGSDGVITSASYVGTQGSADKGIALLESDKNVDFVMTGDPGDSLRAAVNAGLAAHADFTTDRMSFVNGNSGMTSAAAILDVANYRSLRVCYIDCWAYQRDDVDGTERLVAPAPFAVSTAANLSPSTSFSWKSVTAQRMMSSITRLETPRGDAAYQNELAGICTLQREDNGGYTFEAAVVTAAPLDPAKSSYKRTRMGHYMAKAVYGSLRNFVDSPNVAFNQQDEVNAVHDFLDGLKKNATLDPNNLPHIVDFTMRPLADFNSQSGIDAGQFTIPADVKISSDQKQIFFSLQFGETVKVTAEL
jgi:hypothetical protein